jgi:hypothetical protein
MESDVVIRVPLETVIHPVWYHVNTSKLWNAIRDCVIQRCETDATGVIVRPLKEETRLTDNKK